MFRSIIRAIGLGAKESAANPETPTSDADAQTWDVFISHASEDKEEIVRPLASALNAFGLRVWYDEFALVPGDNLVDMIDHGLAQTGLGVVVLSEHFINKRWTEYELNTLSARHVNSGAPLVSVLYDMEVTDLRRHAPALATLPHFTARDHSPVQLASLIIRHARPDMIENILLRMSRLDAADHAETKAMPVKDVQAAPIRHRDLPDALKAQIRLIRALLLGAYTQTYEFWLDGFQRDSNPTKNVCDWLMLAAVLRETNTYLGILTPEQIETLTQILLGIGMVPFEKLQELETTLPGEDVTMLMMAGLQGTEPAVDIETRLPVGADSDAGLGFPTFPFHHEPGDGDRCTILFADDGAELARHLHDTLDAYDLDVTLSPMSEGAGADLSHTLVILSPQMCNSQTARATFRTVPQAATTGRLILPIWHGITPSEAEAFSAALFNLLAYDSAGLDPARLADKIVAEHFPRKAEGVLRRLFMRHADFDDPHLFYRMPERRSSLTDHQRARIRAIRAGLFIAFPVSHGFMVDAFRRELNIEGELYFWEKAVAVLHELTTYFQIPPGQVPQDILRYSIAFLSRHDTAVAHYEENVIKADLLPWLQSSLVHGEPRIELDGPTHILDENATIAPDLTEDSAGSDVAAMFKGFDKERFPIDLPEELVRELMQD